ncbi:hypothetical protein [Enterovirga rhinocerotis]|uniref:hypothetical protein n=1 Tax=Enterovirga rhinocerotis TaxID=1339210 RepID=UPI001061539B|nr:hypothetical protein [Enterovirga rhinocerotis]
MSPPGSRSDRYSVSPSPPENALGPTQASSLLRRNAEVDHARTARAPAPYDPDDDEDNRPTYAQMLSLPQRRADGGNNWLSFLIFVMLPTALFSFYYVAMASEQYVSEFRFAVTETSSHSSPAMGGSGNGVASLLGGMGVPTMTSTQNYIVTDYITSRQAIDELEKRINVTSLYSKGSIDWFSRFGQSNPIEHFVRYWQKMVTSRFDPITGLATVEIRAFTPEDARLVASALVTLSEELVNGIAMRSKTDSVKFAEAEVRRGEERLMKARAAVTEFRIAEGVIDPTTSVVSGNIADIATVRAILIQLQTEYGALEKQNVSATSPAAVALQSRIRATREQLKRLESEVAKERSGNSTLTNVVGRYEQLDLERQYAQNMLTSAMTALDQARAAAGSQSLYLTPYVRPGLPESATYPKKLQTIALIFVSVLAVWFVGLLAWRSFRQNA